MLYRGQGATLDQVEDRLPQAKQYNNGTIWGLCPFHDDNTPSLKVTKKGYYCQSCNAKGSIRKLLSALRGPRGLVRDEPTPPKYSVLPPYSSSSALAAALSEAHDRLMTTDRLKIYLRQREIEDMAVQCQIGWMKEYFTFPIIDENDTIVGGVARAGSTTQNRRYLVAPGQPPMLYIPDHHLWHTQDKVFVAFGMIDAITIAKLGFAAASPTSGKSSIDAEWFRDLKKRVYFVPDRSEERDAVQYASRLGLRGRVLFLPYTEDAKDPNDLLVQGYGQMLVEQLERR